MQFNEEEKVLQLFSESGRENAEGYFVTLGSAQDILDSIAAGNPEHAVALYRAAFDRALPITNSMWMDHLLLFRQMQACMMLGLFLHHGYLLHLPGQALYTVFQDRTNQLMYMKDPDEASDIAAELGFASASHLGSLFKQQEGLTPRQYRLQQRQLGK